MAKSTISVHPLCSVATPVLTTKQMLVMATTLCVVLANQDPFAVDNDDDIK